MAQPGSALVWGASGRPFKSARPDHFVKSVNNVFTDFFYLVFSHIRCNYLTGDYKFYKLTAYHFASTPYRCSGMPRLVGNMLKNTAAPSERRVDMDFIRWKDDYSVQVREIDEQHKKLISLINRLADAMKVGKGRDVLETVLTEMVDYTVYHFEMEEKLFQQHGYPDYEKHKQIHTAFASKAQELKSAFDAGNTKISVDVMLILSNWLNNHILEEDKRYGPYLNGKGVR